MRPTRAEIDLAAIRHNIAQIRTHIGPSRQNGGRSQSQRLWTWGQAGQ